MAVEHDARGNPGGRVARLVPEQIEWVESRYALEGLPPRLKGVPDWIDRAIDKKVKAA